MIVSESLPSVTINFHTQKANPGVLSAEMRHLGKKLNEGLE